MRRIFAVFVTAILGTAAVMAQAGAGTPQGAAAQGPGRGRGGPQVVSPQVNPDRTVTLRRPRG